jgi:hypothetical protein
VIGEARPCRVLSFDPLKPLFDCWSKHHVMPKLCMRHTMDERRRIAPAERQRGEFPGRELGSRSLWGSAVDDPLQFHRHLPVAFLLLFIDNSAAQYVHLQGICSMDRREQAFEQERVHSAKAFLINPGRIESPFCNFAQHASATLNVIKRSDGVRQARNLISFWAAALHVIVSGKR